MATLIVETGTNVPNANSYCDTTTADAVNDMFGNTDWANLDQTTKEANLIQATLAINMNYGADFIGDMYDFGPTPTLMYPRFGYHDGLGRWQPGNSVPTDIKYATSVLAFLLSQGDVDLAPLPKEALAVKKKSIKAGKVSTDTEFYGDVKTERYDGYRIIDNLLQYQLRNMGRVNRVRL